MNFNFKKVLTSLLASFALSKKQKFRSIHAHSWNPPPPHHSQCYISLSVWCVFCSFTPSLSVLFVFHRKSLVLLHLMNRYTTSTIEHFFKRKYMWKVNFWYQWIIQCNTDSWCEYMARDVNLYGCVSLLVPECAGYLNVYACKTNIKTVLVQRYQGFTWIYNIVKWNNTSNVARSPI